MGRNPEGGQRHRDVLGRPDPGAGAAAGADRLHAEPVRQHGVVLCLRQTGLWQLQPRREDAEAVAVLDEALHLVQREEVFYAVAELGRGGAGVVGEVERRVAPLPAALVLQRLRQVPVIERGEGFDAVG